MKLQRTMRFSEPSVSTHSALVCLGVPRRWVYHGKTTRHRPKEGKNMTLWRRPVQHLWALLEAARAGYMRQIRSAHPDAGGSEKRALGLNLAWQQVKRRFAEHGFAIGLLAFCLTCAASSVTVGWDSNPDDQDVVLYKVYWGPELENVTSTTELCLTLTQVPPGTNWAVVTALNEVGESDPSNMISFVGTEGVTLWLQRSTNLTTWANWTNFSPAPTGYWRLKAE